MSWQEILAADCPEEDYNALLAHLETIDGNSSEEARMVREQWQGEPAARGWEAARDQAQLADGRDHGRPVIQSA